MRLHNTQCYTSATQFRKGTKDLSINDFELVVPNVEPMNLKQALEGLPEATMDEVCNAPYSSRYMSRNRKRGWNQASYTIPAMAKQVTLYPGSPDMEKVDKDEWKFGESGITRRLS